MLIVTLSPRKLFEGKAWYSMIKNGNVLIMIRASQAVFVSCYTKPLSKIRIWIWMPKISSGYERLVDSGKLCVRILSRMQVRSYRSYTDYVE